MKILSIFNNKGGVGKSTLTFHLAHALGTLGKRVIIIDADPQCNLSLYGISEEELETMWGKEEAFINTLGFEWAKKREENLDELLSTTRSFHFLLKPTEDGTEDLSSLPPLKDIGNNVFLLPGRLSLHTYEEAIASRWSDAYIGNPLALKTISKIRDIARNYAQEYRANYVIIDTSPSIGILNKVVISNSDAMIIPCNADMFSLYGIQNIGASLSLWVRQFETMKSILSSEKQSYLPDNFVRFIGFTLYKCKKVGGKKSMNELNIAQSNFNYAQRIPTTILSNIKPDLRNNLSDDLAKTIMGNNAIIHSHETLPGMAQKYKHPIWELPSLDTLDQTDSGTIKGNRAVYESTKESYQEFARDTIERIQTLSPKS